MQLVSLFIPLLTSFYTGLFGRFIEKTGGFQLARFGILLSWISNFSSLSWVMYFVVVITVAFGQVSTFFLFLFIWFITLINRNFNFIIKNPNTNTDVLIFSGRILSKYEGIVKANGLYNVNLVELVYVRKNVNIKIKKCF